MSAARHHLALVADALRRSPGGAFLAPRLLAAEPTDAQLAAKWLRRRAADLRAHQKRPALVASQRARIARLLGVPTSAAHLLLLDSPAQLEAIAARLEAVRP